MKRPHTVYFSLPYLALVMLLLAAAPTRADEASPDGFLSPEQLEAQGFIPLLEGDSLDAWQMQPWLEGHWGARDGILDYDGKGEHKESQQNYLWTKESFEDVILYIEWRLPAAPELKPHPIVLYNGDFLMKEDNPRQRATRMRMDAGDSGVLLRGTLQGQINIWSQELGSGELNNYRKDKTMPPEIRRAAIPLDNADRPFGQWNAFLITLQDDRLNIVLNGTEVINTPRLPELPPSGPIGLQHHGDPIQFRNIWVKRLPQE